MTVDERPGGMASGQQDVVTAILRTLAYADVFDFALTPGELHRYLVGARADGATLERDLARLDGRVVQGDDGLLALAGREALLSERRLRRRLAARTWPAAIRHARAMGSLPFVRMVAVSGSLAVGNATEGADIDLMVVTAPGRVWLTRAACIALVRAAAREGVRLCPNYVVAEDVLAVEPHDLYAAHELAQLVPIVGRGTYRRLRAANPWTAALLPNATGVPFGDRARRGRVLRPLTPWAESVLRSPLGDAAERWEQRRKIPRLTAEAIAQGVTGEAGFSPEVCKGHLEGHGARIRAAYEARLTALGVEPLW